MYIRILVTKAAPDSPMIPKDPIPSTCICVLFCHPYKLVCLKLAAVWLKIAATTRHHWQMNVSSQNGKCFLSPSPLFRGKETSEVFPTDVSCHPGWIVLRA